MWIRLNRPEAMNSLTPEVLNSIDQALNDAEGNQDVRAVVLTGTGRAFCAGRDVSAAPTDKDLELVQAVSRAIVAHRCPVIAAVHGWTVGAGFEWTMNADIVFAAADARFKLPEASLGVFVTGGLVATLPAYPFHDDPRWAHQGSHYVIGSHYELIHDNLIDLSHVGYVHGKTIGGTPAAHSTAQVQVTRLDSGAVVRRFMPDTTPPPTYVRAVGFTGKIE